MDFWTVIESRYSVRIFDTTRDVPHKQVKRLLRAAIQSPSAGNRQPWHFVVVRDERVKEALAAAAWGQLFVAQAPVVIVVCADPEQSAERYRERGTDLYCLQDTAAATEHILLAAVADGLGTCWVGAFEEELAAEALGLDPKLRPVALIPVGYPAKENSRKTSRRTVSEAVSYI